MLKAFYGMRLRSKLLLLYFVFLFVPLILISSLYYELSSSIMLDNAQKDLYSLVRKNNELMNAQFSTIKDTALYLTVDKDLIRILNGSPPATDGEFIRRNNEILMILERYFLTMPDIYSYHMATDYYEMVGNLPVSTIPNYTPKMYVPQDTFYDSQLYRAAADGDGSLEWVPTYNYEETYRQDQYKQMSYPHRYLFSAVKQINCLSQQDGRRNPVLIVSYTPDYFSKVFSEQDNEWGGADYYLMTDAGTVVHATNGLLPGTAMEPALIEAIQSNSGYVRMEFEGQPTILVYDYQAETGWMQLATMPYDAVISRLSLLPRYLLLACVALMTIVIVCLLQVSYRLTKPLYQVVEGMERIGEGNFKIHLPVPETPEIGFLASRFNTMIQTIDTLITENYEAKLRERETQIAVLNLQMNPHFLYNTINTINWMALEEGNREVSRMLVSLSQMLQYTLKSEGNTNSVEEDLKWLQSYLYIMKTRYEDKFSVDIDIDPVLLKSEVPKCMFQPVVENAIVHGFSNMEEGGRIYITGRLEDGRRIFRVSDNGNGFDEPADKLLTQNAAGIGLSNLHHRIGFQYGCAYGIAIQSSRGEGTTVTITLPADPANRQ